MNRFIFLFCLIFISFNMHGQTPANNPTNCQTGISIQVFSSNMNYIILGNAAPFLFVPSTGQLTDYILTEVGTTAPFAEQTVLNAVGNPNNTFNFSLPSNVTTTDLIKVEMTVTNTNGHVCFVRDTFEWGNIGSSSFPVFRWRNIIPQNFGTFSSMPPLPVEWISFSGENIDGDVTLYWRTSSEVNNEGYDVLVSSDNILWATIGFVKGKGNTSLNSDYNFVHKGAPSQRLYYKLIQKDYDGKTNESKIISIDNSIRESAASFFTIYPNPSSGKAYIDLGSSPVGSLDINIYNSIGQLVMSKNQKDLNDSIMTLDMPEKGLYFIQINKDGHQQIKQFFVE